MELRGMVWAQDEKGTDKSQQGQEAPLVAAEGAEVEADQPGAMVGKCSKSPVRSSKSPVRSSKSPVRPDDNSPEWLSVTEVAVALGLCAAQVRSLVGAGSIGAVRVGSCWRISRADVERLQALRETCAPQERRGVIGRTSMEPVPQDKFTAGEMTLVAASRMFQVHPVTIRRWVLDGSLQSVLRGNRRWVNGSDLARRLGAAPPTPSAQPDLAPPATPDPASEAAFQTGRLFLAPGSPAAGPTPPESRRAPPEGPIRQRRARRAGKTGIPGAAPIPPSDIIGKWTLTGEHIRQAIGVWMTAHREKWPGEPYPCLSGKDRGLIKLLVEMFGPDTWARVAAMVCRDWLAFQEKYRVQATRPDIVSVFRFRNDLSALALKGGIFSRSNRNSCWGDKAAKIEITNSPIGW